MPPHLLRPALATTRLRSWIAVAATLLLSACGGGGDDGTTSPTPTPTPTPTPAPSPSVPALASATIATGGGTVTVTKSGDPLDGLTLTVPSGAYATSTTLSIRSLAPTGVPTAPGFTIIGPMVTITADQTGLARKPMTLVVPAKIPAGTVPFVAMYDSTSKRIIPLQTITRDSNSVIAILPHLDGSAIPLTSAPTARSTTSFDGLSLSTAQAGAPYIPLITFAIAPGVLLQDWDTGFRPGTDDWAFGPISTNGTGHPIIAGAAVSEAWYFATGLSSTPLRSRYPVAGTATLSNRGGIRFAATTDNNTIGFFLSNIGNIRDIGDSAIIRQIRTGTGFPPGAEEIIADSLTLMRVRASFALASLSGLRPVPLFVEMRGADSTSYAVVAYSVRGRRISVADATRPGDATLALNFPPGAPMTPYSALGRSLKAPISGMLGELIIPASIANIYTASLDPNNTSFDRLFPPSRFGSWFGRVYDTTYVVDTLRVWGECPGCQTSFATTLTPRPAAKLLNAWQTYVITGTAPSDSLGPLSSNGIRIDSGAVPVGGERRLGFPFGTASTDGIASAGSRFTWLDWRTLVIRRLAVTMTPASRSVKTDSLVTFQISVPTAQLPPGATYRFTWNDGTAVSNTDTASTARHAFAAEGTYRVVGEIIDPRNSQVIGRAQTTITASASGQLWSSWRVVPTGVVALPNMPTTDTAGYTPLAVQATNQIVRWWNAPTTGTRDRTFWYVAATTAIPGQGNYQRGLYLTDAGQPNAITDLLAVLTAAAYRPGTYDDDALAWTFTGPAAASSGSVTGSFITTWPDAFIPQPCLGQDQAPYVTHTVTFNMSGNTATGSIVYNFRAIRASCRRPRAVLNSWQLQVNFTATRIR